MCTDKKAKKIYKEIQNRAVGKSYMRKGFLYIIYDLNAQIFNHIHV